jgi:hypothetical protein
LRTSEPEIYISRIVGRYGKNNKRELRRVMKSCQINKILRQLMGMWERGQCGEWDREEKGSLLQGLKPTTSWAICFNLIQSTKRECLFTSIALKIVVMLHA